MTDDRQAPTADVREALAAAVDEVFAAPGAADDYGPAKGYYGEASGHFADMLIPALRARGLVLANADDPVRVAAQEWADLCHDYDLNERGQAIMARLRAALAASGTDR